MADKCTLELQEKLKGFYKPKELELKAAEFELQIENTMKQAEKEGLDPIKLLEEKVNANIREIEMEARSREMQIAKYNTVKTQLAEFPDAQTGIESTLYAIPGKKYVAHAGNIESNVAANRRKRSAMIMSGLSDIDGGLERVLTGEFDSDVMRLISGELSEAEMGRIPKEAHTIHKTLQRHSDLDYKQKLQVGANVKYKKGRVFKQRHNARNMEALGKEEWSQIAKQEWDLDNALDIYKSGKSEKKLKDIEENPQLAIDKYISDFYDNVLKNEGKQGIDISDDFKSMMFTGQKASLEKSASVRFKDSQAQLRYNQQVNGKSVLSMALEDVRDNSGYIGSAEIYGPNPTTTFNKLLNESKDIKVTNLKGKFKLASGRRAGVARSLAAKSAEKIRKLSDVTRLGTAIFSTLPDFSLGALVISNTTGKGYFESLGGLLSDTMKSVPTSHRSEVQRRLAVYTDDILYGNMNTRIGEGSGLVTNTFDEFSIAESKKAVADLDFKKMAAQGGNLIDAGHQQFMKYTGLPKQSEIIRTALAKNMAEHLSDVSTNKFNDLYPGTRSIMERFGIGEKEWDLLREIPSELSDGSKVIDTESIYSIDGAKTGKLSEVEADEYIDRLSANYSAMLTFVAEHGSPTPGVKTKAWVDSIDPDTVGGIMMRFFGQYKSFSIAVMDTLKEAYGPEFNKSRMQNFALAGMTGMGLAYMGDTAKRAVQGKERRPLMSDNGKIDANLAKDMILRAGMGGLWADFLMTDYNSSWRSLGADVAGPGIGVIEGGLKTAHGFGSLLLADNDKESKKAKKQILRGFEQNSPHLLFTKSLINKNFYDILHKAANTGAKR